MTNPSHAPKGVFSDAHLQHALAQAWINPGAALAPNQLQPASLDLRLGAVAFRVRASFLPGTGASVRERIDDGLSVYSLDLTEGAVLEKGGVYLAPLMESLALPPDVHASANPKSSTGRIDVFTRMIVDRATRFDAAPAGYCGPLWAEICPCTFPIRVRAGARLSQLRLRRGPITALREEAFSIGFGSEGPVGYRAKRHADVVDVDRIAGHDPRDFWEPLEARRGRVVLDPGEFYIFASKENVVIPTGEAAEMAPILPELGEFRAHYAGFFDPGFGVSPQVGRAVLEVRSRDVPFILEDGQPVGRLVFEKLTGPCDQPYGQSGSSYQGQGLKLSKHFRAWV